MESYHLISDFLTHNEHTDKVRYCHKRIGYIREIPCYFKCCCRTRVNDKAEKYSVKVTLASTTGISTRNPIDIQYAWVEAPEVDESEIEVPGATVNLDGYTDEGSCVSVGYSWNEELAVCEEKETVSDEIEVLMQVI